MKNKYALYFLLAPICISMLLNQCAAPTPPPEEQQAVKPISKTIMEVYADESQVIYWPGDNYPLTMICELRDKSSGSLQASQIFTWTVPAVEEYTPDLIVPPAPLTWTLELAPGWYEERCRLEIDGRHFPGPGEPEKDFYIVNSWRSPWCHSLFFKAR